MVIGDDAQSWFSVPRQAFLHPISSSIVQSSYPPRAWILRLRVGWSFINFAFSTWSLSNKDHHADRRSFVNSYFLVSGPSLGNCFAIPFLPLLWFSFLGTCVSSSSSYVLFSSFSHTNSWSLLLGFCCSVLYFIISMFFSRLLIVKHSRFSYFHPLTIFHFPKARLVIWFFRDCPLHFPPLQCLQIIVCSKKINKQRTIREEDKIKESLYCVHHTC